MRRLLGLTVGQRVAGALGLLLLIVLAGNILSLSLTNQSTAAVEQGAQSLEEVDAVTAVQRAWSTVAATIDYMLLTRQPVLVQRELNGEMAAFTAAMAQLQATVQAEGGGAAQLPALAALAQRLTGVAGEIGELAEEGRWARIQALRYTELATFQRRFEQRLALLAEASSATATAAASQARDVQQRVRLLSQIGSVAAVALALASGYYLTRSLVRPIRTLTAGAERFAQGQMDTRVPLERDDELGRLAEAFNSMAADLQAHYGGLEQRVAERTRALAASIEVGRRLATFRDLDQLATAVVQQLQDSFGYYHVHLYLFDDRREHLVLAGGSGEAGRTMLARGHRLPAGKGLVGRSAQRNEIVLAPDTAVNNHWLPNPLLPDTRAELAVPIRYAGEVLGVLDVQHNMRGGLGPDDAALLESIAGQVAVAVQNARLLQQAEQRAQHAAVANIIGQRIQRATSVAEVLQVAAHELGLALDTERARVQLRSASYTPPGNGQPPANQEGPPGGGAS
jgi:HAMP domain-containing protein/putative methionine-R-sulfoxide reductase with GAF domain